MARLVARARRREVPAAARAAAQAVAVRAVTVTVPRPALARAAAGRAGRVMRRRVGRGSGGIRVVSKGEGQATMTRALLVQSICGSGSHDATPRASSGL
jgi:hypothetical protein